MACTAAWHCWPWSWRPNLFMLIYCPWPGDIEKRAVDFHPVSITHVMSFFSVLSVFKSSACSVWISCVGAATSLERGLYRLDNLRFMNLMTPVLCIVYVMWVSVSCVFYVLCFGVACVAFGVFFGLGRFLERLGFIGASFSLHQHLAAFSRSVRNSIFTSSSKIIFNAVLPVDVCRHSLR